MLSVCAIVAVVCLGWFIVQDLETARKRKAAHEYRARLATALRAAQTRIERHTVTALNIGPHQPTHTEQENNMQHTNNTPRDI